MNRQDDKDRHSETLKRILEAAADIFADSGFAGARMDEIARQAGVNKATIYYHIGGKQSLYVEVIRRVIGSVADRIMYNTRDIVSPEGKIRAYVNTISEAMDANPRMPSIMLREIASGGLNLPDIIIEDFARIISIVRGIVDDGVERNLFVQKDPLLVHLMVVGTFALFKATASVRSRYATRSGEAIEQGGEVSGEIASQVADAVVKALTKQAGKEN